MLDVQMPGLTGFEVARRLRRRPDRARSIVFVTAYDQHAIEAFEVNAVDYLLKPVEPSRLATAVRARAEARSQPSGRRQAAAAGRTTARADRCSCVSDARAAANSWRSRSATASCWCRPTRSSTRPGRRRRDHGRNEQLVRNVQLSDTG